MKKLSAKLKVSVSAFFYLIAEFFPAKSCIKNRKVSLLIGVRRPRFKSLHLDGVPLFASCLGCGFRISLYGVKQWLILLSRLGKEGIALLNWANHGNSLNLGGGKLLFANIDNSQDFWIEVQRIADKLETPKCLLSRKPCVNQRQVHWREIVTWKQPS